MQPTTNTQRPLEDSQAFCGDTLMMLTCCSSELTMIQLGEPREIDRFLISGKGNFAVANDDFGAWIEKHLQLRGWTASQLARESGVDPAQISRILNQGRGIGPESCTKIARALSVSPVTVFRAAGFLPPVSETTDQAEDLLYLFSQLSPGTRQLLISIARLLNEDKPYSRTHGEEDLEQDLK